MRDHRQWVQAEMRKITGRTSVKLRIRIRGDRLNQTLRFPKGHVPVFTYGGHRRVTVGLRWKLFFRTKVPQIIITRSHHNAVRYFICPASRHPVFRPPDRACGLEASPQFIGNRSRNVFASSADDRNARFRRTQRSASLARPFPPGSGFREKVIPANLLISSYWGNLYAKLPIPESDRAL